MNPLLQLQLDVAFAERAARYVTYAYAQERLARSFAAELGGNGDGPSEKDFEQLATALTLSRNADIAYLALLNQAVRELIADVKGPPVRPTTKWGGWLPVKDR
ncbi:hypothetical protein WKW80_14230 [Variovorax humicola]|uniref:Uncharacterized protein n=1 Tax=Variovorax humicola TaxID=1769758 RepID=A0ABU8VZD3_9BURK